jgi:hypothetical protein
VKLADVDDPEVRAQCVHVARQLRHAERRIIGLLPTADDVGVPAVGVQLGLALADVSGATIAFVDANLRWPAIADIEVAAEKTGDDASAFVTRWLRGSLALLTPLSAGQAGAGVPQLAKVIQHGAWLFAHVLVDLTGFKKLGEHLAAIDMVDAVVVIARAGKTIDAELLRLKHELPAAKTLGVLLVG